MDRTGYSDVIQDINISEISSFANQALLTNLVNKLADYADVISETKLSSIINHNYNFSGDQVRAITEFLVNSRAVSRICMVAQKGSKDFNYEYMSNIFSNPENPENSMPYQSLRRTIELRLTQQVQQFNINMGEPNIARPMPLTVLRSHVKLYESAVKTFSGISSKVQHGYAAASLHDAYVTLISRLDFWKDKMYTKFFLYGESADSKDTLLTLHQEKKSIFRINKELKDLIDGFDSHKDGMTIMRTETLPKVVFTDVPAQEEVRVRVKKKLPSLGANPPGDLVMQAGGWQIHSKSAYDANPPGDSIMQTPFGRQYGGKINSIISEICSKAGQEIDTAVTGLLLSGMYNRFCDDRSSITPEEHGKQIVQVIDSILFVDTDIADFSEIFLYRNRKESFAEFFKRNSSVIEAFLSIIFGIYFQERFKSFLKFIKTDEMMTFTSAFIIKRIYIMFGDAITIFGFFLIKAVAVAGKVQIGKV